MTSRTYIRQNLILLLLLLAAGCSNSEEEEPGEPPGGGALVRIDVSTTSMDGWGTVPVASTHLFDNNESSYSCTADENTHLIMSVHTERERMMVEDEPSGDTRGNLEKDILFRVVAYRCATKNKILASNYAGYGEYKITNTSGAVIATKEMLLQADKYTFVCYSQGTGTLPTFSSSDVSLSVSNGVDFMTAIKEGVIISRYVNSYTLSSLNFTRRCARMALKVVGSAGNMTNITACQAILTLPKSTATYSFTGNTLTVSGDPGTTAVTWANPNAITVTSPYVCVLPQAEANIPIKLTMTIGGRVFSDVEILIPNQVLAASTGYISNIGLSFNGYIVGGALWAPGNLALSGGYYVFFGSSEGYSGTPLGGDYWNWNTLDPTNVSVVTVSWDDNNDPCRKILPLNYWRSANARELTELASLSSINSVVNNIKGRLFGDILFLPKCGYRHNKSNLLDNTTRGLYWSGGGGHYFLDFSDSTLPKMNATATNDGLSIRCVKN